MTFQFQPFLTVLFTAALLSALLAWGLVLTRRWHGHYSLDHDLSGVQKTHSTPVPRAGGIAVLGGLLGAALLVQYEPPKGLEPPLQLPINTLLALTLAGLPVLIAGLLEDLTKKVSTRTRLLSAFGAAALAWLFFRWRLPRVDTPGLDWLMQWSPFAVVFTCFAVGGITHAVNIIDGFHGLASTTLLLLFAGLGGLAWVVGDTQVLAVCATGMGLSLGFLTANYPRGRIFLGDGGAYLLGFLLAESAVMLIQAHPPSQVRVWQVLAICGYPFIEVVFSMYRRRLIHQQPTDAPDRLHLHSLVYRRLARPWLGQAAAQPWRANAAVVLLLAPFIATTVLLALLLGHTTPGAVLALALSYSLYLYGYRRLVRFRSRQGLLALLWRVR